VATSEPAAAPPAVDQLLRDIEPEYNYRKLTGVYAAVVAIIAGGMSLFHLYTARFGTFEALRQRSAHVAFVVALIFLLYPARRRGAGGQTRFGVLDVLTAVGASGVMLYLFVNAQALAMRSGRLTVLDLVVGVLGLIIVLEAGRRVIAGIPYIAAVMLIYPFIAPYLPGALGAPPVTIQRVVDHMFFTTEGIFGIPIGVSATFVFLFVLMGAFLERTGLGQMFVDIAMALAGWMTGGPAKVSVLSSAFIGTVSGSSVANVVTDGVFNIPLMKRVGYSAKFAAGVEAATSVGGQLMPPVMGAAAFVMAEFLGVPYLTVVRAAIIPALLYFLAVGVMIHFEAKRLGLRGLTRAELPSVRSILFARWYLVAPLVFVVGFLLEGYTPMTAAFWGIVTSAGVHVITVVLEGIRGRQRVHRMAVRWIVDMWTTLVYGARNALGVAMACAVVGIIIGVVTLTGVGLKFVSLTVALGQHSIFLTLVLVALACIIIGSGIPTTATYIILAAIAAPALAQLGVPLIAGHLFILYFGMVADLTPPEALAAYAAAGIARTDPFPAALVATRLALGGFLVPFAFVYDPALLLVDVTVGEAILASATALVGVLALGGGAIGYFLGVATPVERVMLLGAAVALVFHNLFWDVVGLGLIGVTLVLQRYRQVRLSSQVAEGVRGR
jgi:TRAP transporter 4TM/12TM fusion protein